MKDLNMVKIAFDTTIKAKEIPAFQAALSHRLGFAELSKSQMPGYYPLIQYKTRRSHQQQQPLMVILGQHPKLFYKLSQQGTWEANISGRKIQMKVAHAKATQFQVQLRARMQQYALFNYQPLNQADYQRYQQCQTDLRKQQLLSEILHFHIQNFARGIDWQIEGELKVIINHIIREKPIPYQGFTAQCFDLKFQANAFLPEYIGLGKGLRKGFGTLRGARSGE